MSDKPRPIIHSKRMQREAAESKMRAKQAAEDAINKPNKPSPDLNAEVAPKPDRQKVVVVSGGFDPLHQDTLHTSKRLASWVANSLLQLIQTIGWRLKKVDSLCRRQNVLRSSRTWRL